MNIVLDRWKNRRRMSWIAFASAITFPFVMYALKIPEIVVIPFYSFVGSVVALYIGGAVVDDWLQKS